MRRAAWIILIVVLGGVLNVSCTPSVSLPGPDRETPILASDYFVAADGTSMKVRSWLPENGNIKAVIIALHGFNDYGNFFAAPGSFFAGRGIASYAYDQRGFGETPVRGIWPGITALVNDLKSFTKLVGARHPGVPLYILGASMGGAVTMVAMASDGRPNADGVILAAPAVWARSTMAWYQRSTLWIGAHTVPWMKLSGRGLKIRPSDNREMLLALGRDPLIIKKTRIDTIYGVTNLMDAALASSSKMDYPALFLYGDLDQIIPRKPVMIMLKQIPEAAVSHQKFAFYKNGYHMLLRDMQGRAVWNDIATWIENPKEALASGADQRAMSVMPEK